MAKGKSIKEQTTIYKTYLVLIFGSIRN